MRYECYTSKNPLGKNSGEKEIRGVS